AESGAPPCRSRGHLFSEIGAVEYGERKLGPVLAGGGLCGARNRSLETAGAIGVAGVAVGSAGVLFIFDCVRLGTASCLHLVAICHLQPALRTPVAADVCGFDRSAGGFYLSTGGGRHKGKMVAVILALVVGSYVSVWKAEPQCLAEARRNWVIRNPLNSAVQRVLARLPKNSRFLMDISE